jgi:acetyl esterase/lipase
MTLVVRYGPADGQEADLLLPPASAGARPVVCLLHGGWWRMPHGRDQLNAIAADLASRGYAVWNVEYRRVGAPGGGWPSTFDDVAAAIDHLATLRTDGVPLDLRRVVVVGHSAGGHLALWSGAPDDRTTRRVRPSAVAGLAPIADLAGASALGLGAHAAGALLGGSPADEPARYAAASPLERLPLGVPQLVVHGALDAAVPVALSRRYARAATAAGDTVEYVELPDAGHMDFVDPGSGAHAVLVRWLASHGA